MCYSGNFIENSFVQSHYVIKQLKLESESMSTDMHIDTFCWWQKEAMDTFNTILFLTDMGLAMKLFSIKQNALFFCS